MPHLSDPPDDSPDLNTYRQVFDASPDFISISRLSDGAYLDVNPGYEYFTGYARAEVIGRTAGDLGIWVDENDRQQFVQALLQARNLKGFATRLRNRTGDVRHIEASATITLINGEQVIVAIVRDVTERKRIEKELNDYREHLEQKIEQRTEELRHMAQHDVLTGLPNRALLEDRIAQAIHHAQRNRNHMAVMMIDLDKFKPVNDILGHQAGDELLRAVALRLQQSVRRIDTLARFGGDEFVVILLDLHEKKQAALVAEKILSLLQTVFVIAETEVHIGGSIGIALYPTDGVDAHLLMQRADKAMYGAKHTGRGRYVFFGDSQT